MRLSQPQKFAIPSSPSLQLNNLTASDDHLAFVANQRVILSTFSGKSTVLQGIGEESSIHKVSFLMTRGGPILAILHGLEVILFRGTRKLATVDFGDPPQEAGFDKLVCIVPSYQEGLYLVTSMRGSVFRLVQHEREGVWEHGGLLNTVPLMDTSSHSFFLTCSTRVGRDTLLFGTDEGEVMTSTGVFARQLPETSGSVTAIVFIPSESYSIERMAVSYQSGHISLWSLPSEENVHPSLLCLISAHDRDISSLLYLGNEKILSSSYDGVIRIWDVGPPRKTIVELMEEICPNEGMLVGCTTKGRRRHHLTKEEGETEERDEEDNGTREIFCVAYEKNSLTKQTLNMF